MTTAAVTVIQALQSSPLAQGLDAEQLALLATRMRLQAVQAQQLLSEEGQADNRLFVIVQGALSIVKHRGTPDETPLATLNTGDLAHELGFLDGAKRNSSLLGATDSLLLVLEREQLEGLIDSHPRILYAVMCTVVRSVHRVQVRLSQQASELTNYIVKQHGRY
jgi:CRP/FNR family cyclic AMP-dependent transcriptional regulator